MHVRSVAACLCGQGIPGIPVVSHFEVETDSRAGLCLAKLCQPRISDSDLCAVTNKEPPDTEG